jgi:hypothetical protein
VPSIEVFNLPVFLFLATVFPLESLLPESGNFTFAVWIRHKANGVWCAWRGV